MCSSSRKVRWRRLSSSLASASTRASHGSGAALHYGGGPDALGVCDRLEVEHGADSAALMAALLPIIEATERETDAVLRACRQAQTAGQFRELLDFEFARFNESLLASGSEPLAHLPYGPRVTAVEPPRRQ